jgi:hypothetical protein
MTTLDQAVGSGTRSPLAVDRGQALMFVSWLAGGIFALLSGVMDPGKSGDRTALWLSLLSLAFGVWLFWTHGERRITAAGLWGFAFALFVGFAGLYSLSVPTASHTGLTPTLIAAYFGQIVMWGLFWTRPAHPAAQKRWPIDPSVARWGIVVGSLILVVSSAAGGRFGEETDIVVDAAAFASIVLLSASLLLLRGEVLGVWRLILAGAAFGIYAIFLFSGFGRLILGSLGLALGVLMSKQLPGRTLKAILLLATVPTLEILARTRVEFTASLNPNQLDTVSGFESVVGPLASFGELLSRRGQLPLGLGSTFWAAGVSMIPHGLWSGKPEGFGAVLVPYLSPALVGTGHSDAALSHGEWLFDFGLVGLVLMVPVLGWIVRMSDRWLEAANSRPTSTRRHLISLVAATIVACGLPDLLWGGTFTYVSRAGPRLLVLGFILLGSRLRLGTRLGDPRVTVEEPMNRERARSSSSD